MKRPIAAALTVVALLIVLGPIPRCVGQADAPAADTVTVFVSQAERLPTCAHAESSAMPGAEEGAAVVLNSPAACVGARPSLEAGAYTLVFSALAASQGEDALYVTAAGQRSRVAIGELAERVARAHAFQAREAGGHGLVIQPDPMSWALR